MKTNRAFSLLSFSLPLLAFACAVPAPDDGEAYEDGETIDEISGSPSDSDALAPSETLADQGKFALSTSARRPRSILGCLFDCQDDYSECMDQAGGHPDLEKHCGIEKKYCVNECSNPSPTTPLDPPKGIIH